MTPEEKAAYIMAAAARAAIRALGMYSENLERRMHGYRNAYDESHFLAVIESEGIGENQVLEWLRS